MRLLIIYYNFPPAKVPGAVRLKHVYEQSKFHFKDTFVLSCSNRKLYQQDPSLTVADGQIYEVPAYDVRRLLLLFRKENTIQISSNTKSHPYYSFFKKLIDSFPFNILIGDGGLFYILRGYFRCSQLVKKQEVTHLFSSFRPYSDHVIAFLLKRRFPNLYWIADFRDLHMDEKNGKQLYLWNLQRWFNHLIFKNTDKITVVSKGLAQKIKPYKDKIVVLPNGIPDYHLPKTYPYNKHFCITYTGRIYPNEQDATMLFSAIRQLLRENKIHSDLVKLRYAGPTPEMWLEWSKAYQLEANTEVLGFVSTKASRALQVSSAINLSLSFATEKQKGDVSSKFYEYLASRRPILKIINGCRDEEIEALFKLLLPGKLAYNQPSFLSEVKSFIHRQYVEWQNKRKSKWPENQEAYDSLKTENIFKAFFESLS